MNLKYVDHNALRTNQTVIIALLLVGYIFNITNFVYFTALAMLIATIFSVPAFGLLYRYIILPSGIAKPDVKQDDPNAHRFAQLIGGLFLVASSFLLYNNSVIPGWTFTFVVIGLAAVNLMTGFCVGCFFYYQLGKVGFIKPENK